VNNWRLADRIKAAAISEVCGADPGSPLLEFDYNYLLLFSSSHPSTVPRICRKRAEMSQFTITHPARREPLCRMVRPRALQVFGPLASKAEAGRLPLWSGMAKYVPMVRRLTEEFGTAQARSITVEESKMFSYSSVSHMGRYCYGVKHGDSLGRYERIFLRYYIFKIILHL
jgi:hypothetical protein